MSVLLLYSIGWKGKGDKICWIDHATSLLLVFCVSSSYCFSLAPTGMAHLCLLRHDSKRSRCLAQSASLAQCKRHGIVTRMEALQAKQRDTSRTTWSAKCSQETQKHLLMAYSNSDYYMLASIDMTVVF